MSLQNKTHKSGYFLCLHVGVRTPWKFQNNDLLDHNEVNRDQGKYNQW